MLTDTTLKKLLAECYTSYRQPYFLSSETTEKNQS